MDCDLLTTFSYLASEGVASLSLFSLLLSLFFLQKKNNSVAQNSHRQIDALFGCQRLGEWRGEHTCAGGRLRRRWRRGGSCRLWSGGGGGGRRSRGGGGRWSGFRRSGFCCAVARRREVFECSHISSVFHDNAQSLLGEARHRVEHLETKSDFPSHANLPCQRGCRECLLERES